MKKITFKLYMYNYLKCKNQTISLAAINLFKQYLGRNLYKSFKKVVPQLIRKLGFGRNSPKPVWIKIFSRSRSLSFKSGLFLVKRCFPIWTYACSMFTSTLYACYTFTSTLYACYMFTSSLYACYKFPVCTSISRFLYLKEEVQDSSPFLTDKG